MNNNDSYLESLNLSRMATSLKRPFSSVPEVLKLRTPKGTCHPLQGNQRQSWTLETLLWIPDFMINWTLALLVSGT